MRRMFPVLVMLTVALARAQTEPYQSRVPIKWAAREAGTTRFLIRRITACSSHDRIV